MALTLKVESQGIVSVEEMLEFARHRVDGRDPDSVAEAATLLHGYGRNTDIVSKVVEKSMKLMLDGKPMPFASPQTFLIANDGNVIVRGNIWTPTTQTGSLRSREEEVFSYRRAHDHNFHFLTVGHFGPGYETELFEIDPSVLRGRIGDTAPILNYERTSLPHGKVMMYRAHVDIHTQIPPTSLSISLNLMFNHPDTISREQYWFDIGEDRVAIQGYPEGNRIHRHTALVEMASLLGGEESIELLEEVARRDGLTPRVRRTASAGAIAIRQRLAA